MEIKCSGGMPLWMTRILSEQHIYHTSFSKYGTAIQSLILSKSKESYYRIYIIASDLSQQAEGQFKTLATDSAEIHIIQESAEKSFVGFHLYDDKETCVASRAALLKFNIAELLPHLDKVLYLDSDIIVKESLETLFSENIDGYYTAAVHESGCMYYNIESRSVPSTSHRIVE